MRIVFHTSTNCNLRCSYCYQHDKTSPALTFEQAKILIDDLFYYLFDADKSKIFKFTIRDPETLKEINLDFFGGEASLYIDLISQICDYFEECCNNYKMFDWKKNYKITIETNGTTFFKPEVYRFYESHRERIDLPITIDGCKNCHNACRKYADGTGSYDDVEKAIIGHKELLGTCPNSKLTFSLENMKYIKDSFINLINLGYKGVRSSFDTFTHLSKEDSDKYYNYLKEAIDYVIDNKIQFFFGFLWSYYLNITSEDRVEWHRATCGADGGQIAVNWDGNLYFCHQLAESFVGKAKQQIIGNVVDGITPTGFEIINSFRTTDHFIWEPECIGCPIKAVCDSCPASNLVITGQQNNYSNNCGATVAEARAREYFVKRADETDYPYFKEQRENIKKYIHYDPNREYVVDRMTESIHFDSSK